jgi:hypothetical protein
MERDYHGKAGELAFRGFGLSHDWQVPTGVELNIMLEVFKKLAIKVDDPAKLDTFLTHLDSNLAPGWSRDQQAEQRVSNSLPGRDIHAFRWADSKTNLSALLFLARTDDRRFEVTNIVPISVSQLTKAQYNVILDDFAKHADRIATQEGVNVEVTPDKLAIGHWLSEKAAKRLQSFSALANKSTGSSHASDFAHPGSLSAFPPRQ